MVFLFSITFAFGSTALYLYLEISIPLPTNDSDGYASQYETEADFIAIADKRLRIAFLSLHEKENYYVLSSFFGLY